MCFIASCEPVVRGPLVKTSCASVQRKQNVYSDWSPRDRRRKFRLSRILQQVTFFELPCVRNYALLERRIRIRDRNIPVLTTARSTSETDGTNMTQGAHPSEKAQSTPRSTKLRLLRWHAVPGTYDSCALDHESVQMIRAECHS